MYSKAEAEYQKNYYVINKKRISARTKEYYLENGEKLTKPFQPSFALDTETTNGKLAK